jgi:hypothetical protein
MNEDSKSPLCGLLSPSMSKKGMISRVTFNKGVHHILEDVVMSKLPDDKQYMLLRNYFRAIEHNISTPELLTRAAYFEAFCDFFEDVVKMSRSTHSNYKFESMSDILSFIESIDLEQMALNQGKTRVTKITILPILKNALSRQLTVDEDMI